MWHADDRDFLYRRVTQQAAFDLDRRDVFATAYDNVRYRRIRPVRY
jgi:hypothetical protein